MKSIFYFSILLFAEKFFDVFVVEIKILQHQTADVMKPFFGILCLLVCSLSASGQYYKKRQNPDKNYHQHSKQMTIDLSPIVLSRGRYYYDGRHVSFDQLAMPLFAVKDSVVDLHLKSINKTRRIGAVVLSAIGLANLVTWLSVQGSPPSRTTVNLLVGLYIGHAALRLTFNQLTVSHRRKAVDRYNEIILQPAAFVLPGSGAGLGFTAKF